MRQLIFFPGAGKDVLFSQKVLTQFLADSAHDPISELSSRTAMLRSWVDNLRAHDPSSSSESQLESAFVNVVLGSVLGYKIFPETNFSAWPKPPSRATRISTTPDVVLGDFRFDAPPSFLVAVELKSPGTDLDKPQSRDGHATPVEQAFEYGRHILGVRWVIVSDMRLIRLYSVDDPGEYQEFNLAEASENPEEFRKLWSLLAFENLVVGGNQSVTSSLFGRSSERRLNLQDGFYSVYWQIRADLYDAIDAVTNSSISRAGLLEVTQRLLDRVLFILYCEDHPQSLIPRDTLKNLAEVGLRLPGSGDAKVYSLVKELFREVDAGSPPTSGLNVAAFNGELFKWHPILDTIDIPDSLARKSYSVKIGKEKIFVRGVWGLYQFDFYGELGEHMLGRVFEASLSDVAELGTDSPSDLAQRLRERKRIGVFYTSEILADFLATHAITDAFEDSVLYEAKQTGKDSSDTQLRLSVLSKLKILDPACGSGAFLVSSYRVLLDLFWKWHQLDEGEERSGSLLAGINAVQQSALLRDSIFGIDLLVQAVDIAKLALWLRSVRRSELVSDLSGNIVAADSLNMGDSLELIGLAAGSLDVVIGNPPWGGELDPDSYAKASEWLGLDESTKLDSWEIFVLLAIKALRPGGRLAFVLPDSLLYPDKAFIREILLSSTTIDRLHSLGPGWFGPEVRMGTLILEAKKSPPSDEHDIETLLLSGIHRKDAIFGRVPLTQLESQQSRFIPQGRSMRDAPEYPIEVFRDRKDDALIEKINANSLPLATLCDHGRGEEMAKEGRLWVCPSCLNPTVPGRKLKGGRLQDKNCPNCSLLLTENNVTTLDLIGSEKPGPGREPFIDGDDLAHRYQLITPTKSIAVEVPGWDQKDQNLYGGQKILIRQAGVGIVATLDLTGSICPQSLYIYRLKSEYSRSGLSHEYVLAALLSRTMSYVMFKRFGEVDPDKAHPKLTHARLAAFPIPKADFNDSNFRKCHDIIVDSVRSLLNGDETIGGEADRRIEQQLRDLWKISPDEGAYINGQFGDLPYGQAIRELFPQGRPINSTPPVGQLLSEPSNH